MHGLYEVAGQNHYSVKGLRRIGVQADTVLIRPNKYGYPYDHVINENAESVYPHYLEFGIDCMKRASLFRRVADQYDFFHFHSGESFRLLGGDLDKLDRLGKKYVFEYHGSDLRCIDWGHGRRGLSVAKNGLRRQMAQKACTKAARIILHDDELIANLPQTHAPVNVVPLRADLSLFEAQSAKRSDKIVLAHAPSNRAGKGTKYVLEAFEELMAADKRIECILVENMTRSEALSVYSQADIVVDQLITGTYGMLAIESMALGKPVITYITDQMRDRLPAELPIVSSDTGSILETLKLLIADQDWRQELGLRGRRYVEDYHDYRKIAQYLRSVYEGKIESLAGRDAFAYARQISAE